MQPDSGGACPADAPPAIQRGIGIAFAVAIACLIQFQPTVSILGVETRLAASDPVAALLATLGALYLARGRVPRQPWRSRWVWGWIVAMSFVLLAGTVIGRAEIGAWSGWAVQNRLLGWAALLSYFFAGAMLRCFFGESAAARFLDAFVICGGAISALAVAAVLATELGFAEGMSFRTSQLAGLVGNPNAFGVLAILALAAVWSSGSGRLGQVRGALGAVWVAAGYLTLSRATWLGMGVGAGLAVATGRIGLRYAAIWIGAPAVLAAGATAMGGAGSVAWSKFESLAPERSAAVAEASIAERSRLVRTALHLWWSAPAFGVGIGVHWHREQAAVPERPQLIHGTPLWLLAETGFVGLAVFGGFALHAALLLLRAARGARPGPGRVEWTALIFLCAAAVMSLFHDLLYQRLVWLVLGLALVAPRAEPRPR